MQLRSAALQSLLDDAQGQLDEMGTYLGKEEVADHKVTIERAKVSANTDSVKAKIDELAAQMAMDEQNLKIATEIRDKETADVAAEEVELSETIVTIHCAVIIAERQWNNGASTPHHRMRGAGACCHGQSFGI